MLQFLGINPMIRVIIPFILGILMQEYLCTSFSFLVIGIVFLVSLWIILSIYNKKYKYEFINGIILSGIILLIGGSLLYLNKQNNWSNHIGKIVDQNEKYNLKIKIIEQPKILENSIKFSGEILELKHSNQIFNYRGKILTYIELDSQNLNYGDIIEANTYVQKLAPKRNPDQFEYSSYLKTKNIYNQTYISKNNWLKIDSNKGNFMKYYGLFIQSTLYNQLSKTLDSNELSVASALLLGDKTDLDDQLMLNYASAGAMHVLAVSGLHVGIIYLVIILILKPFSSNRLNLIIKTILIILILWIYASVTGYSPSVMRATIMFSLIAIGDAHQRKIGTFNSIASSAFILLVFNPLSLFEVGFQLSYSAVIGIVYFQPKIASLLSFKYKITNWIWQISSVSIAAQLTTFPISLYYFHQFPSYFLLSNLVVIPLATVILYIGIIYFIFSFLPFIQYFIGKLLAATINFLNQFVDYAGTLKYATINEISISELEVCLIYGLILMFSIALYTKKFIYFYWIFSFTIILLSIQIIENHIHKSSSEITFYSIKKEPCIEVKSGETGYLYCSKRLYENKQSMLFNIKHHWYAEDIKHIKHIDIPADSMNFELKINDLKILHVCQNIYDSLEGGYDYIIINKRLNKYDLNYLKDANLILLGTSLNWNTLQLNILFLSENNLSYFNLNEQFYCTPL